MVSVRFLCREQGQRPEEVLAWALANGHQIYRLRRGTLLQFFILPGDSSLPLQLRGILTMSNSLIVITGSSYRAEDRSPLAEKGTAIA